MNQLTPIIKKAMPAVVSIVISKKLEDIEKELPREMMPVLPFGTPELKIPEDKIDARGMVQIGGGSGFIVDAHGIILTNKHVISERDAEYTAVTDDGAHYQATVVAIDPVDDVAILKIAAEKLPVLKLGNSSKIELGESVLTIGNSLGLFQNTVSSGIISGLSRSITARSGPKSSGQELRGLIQTDAAINPGNSGGPLLNLKGEVIGINTAIVSGAQNIGFAIPVNAARRDLEDLKKFGRVRRPLLGLRYITIDDNLKQKMHLPVDYGALVTGTAPHHEAIIPDSPAARSGFRERDIILECNSEKLTFKKTIQDFLEEANVGDTLTMKVMRGAEHLEIKVELAERK